MNHRTVGLLSTEDNPLLPYVIDEVEKLNAIEVVLVLDAKVFSRKNQEIFAQRTGGAFPPRDIAPYLGRLRYVTADNHNGPDCVRFVQSSRIDLLVNAGTPRLVKQELLSAPSIGVLNVHPGILPKYRGSCCCEWALYNGDPVGLTAHFMDAGLDSGPIIFTRHVADRFRHDLPGHSGCSIPIELSEHCGSNSGRG